ncbi:unnamed protein product [Mytilus edulis]|uniref:Uncharacterized protein n=1 Tax=Mytilus edulis TaxID=6550 RepID=A0A8S3TQQ8_MYTED|nr:unnamed protein product [Mytilus edulis]
MSLFELIVRIIKSLDITLDLPLYKRFIENINSQIQEANDTIAISKLYCHKERSTHNTRKARDVLKLEYSSRCITEEGIRRANDSACYGENGSNVARYGFRRWTNCSQGSFIWRRCRKTSKGIGNKRKELCQLEREKKALQEQLRNEIGNKNELDLKLIEKETEIKLAESRIKALRKQIQAKEKELNKEKTEMEQIKEKHKTEIESLKKQIDKLKAKIAVNLASDNNAKHALSQIREENEKLQAENEELKRKLQKKFNKQ